MWRKDKNEDSSPLNQTQPKSVSSSCHIGIQWNPFYLVRTRSYQKTDFYCNIYVLKNKYIRIKCGAQEMTNSQKEIEYLSFNSINILVTPRFVLLGLLHLLLISFSTEIQRKKCKLFQDKVHSYTIAKFW